MTPNGAAREAGDVVFRHCRELLTCAGPAPRRGAGQRAVEAVPDGALEVGLVRVQGENVVVPNRFAHLAQSDGLGVSR